ncbi:MAG TPA: DUF4402 domain-containing protein [Sphingomicrobium sp.]|nr:DUF4402 domain-containing protein [Sphingomicrobium sp.]
MTGRNALASGLLAAALLVGAPAPAPAQCRLCSAPTTERLETAEGAPLRLDAQASLDFDRIVMLGAGNGAATLLPNGDRSALGSIATLSARAMVGSVTVRGEPNRTVRVDMPSQVTLHSLNGGQIAIEQLETDLPEMPRLDSAGSLSFQFGGRLTINGDAEGEYRGDVPITVEYL